MAAQQIILPQWPERFREKLLRQLAVNNVRSPSLRWSASRRLRPVTIGLRDRPRSRRSSHVNGTIQFQYGSVAGVNRSNPTNISKPVVINSEYIQDGLPKLTVMGEQPLVKSELDQITIDARQTLKREPVVVDHPSLRAVLKASSKPQNNPIQGREGIPGQNETNELTNNSLTSEDPLLTTINLTESSLMESGDLVSEVNLSEYGYTRNESITKTPSKYLSSAERMEFGLDNLPHFDLDPADQMDIFALIYSE